MEENKLDLGVSPMEKAIQLGIQSRRWYTNLQVQHFLHSYGPGYRDMLILVEEAAPEDRQALWEEFRGSWENAETQELMARLLQDYFGISFKGLEYISEHMKGKFGDA